MKPKTLKELTLEHLLAIQGEYLADNGGTCQR